MKVIENSKENTVDFAKLKPGDCFKWENSLLIKTDYKQDAVDLETGAVYENICGEEITPINAEVRIIN